MKKYTAIYHTNLMKGIQFHFRAKDLGWAVIHCSLRLNSFPDIVIIENGLFGYGNRGKVVWMKGDKV